jgi:hypothetical protein
MDSIAEKVFTSLQRFYSPLSASSYLDFLIVQAYSDVIHYLHFLNSFKKRIKNAEITADPSEEIRHFESA